ncbi:MAG TPA: response regulator [Acidobacteriaceae bacterium]|jgi:CheY-like chemotaxis protein|nr:response regulator [Acidobacteriaceae bacterium]
MVRPCFLVVDREFAGSISTRKLVIETAKFNVLTAYSAREAADTLRKFPGMTAAVIDAYARDMRCDDLVDELRVIQPGIPIVAISAPGAEGCTKADHHLASFDPAHLLELLKGFVPEAAGEIERRNEELEREGH